MAVAYDVPHDRLHLNLVQLRQYLVSIGYPLANNEELNAPDSVIRLAEGYHLVGIKEHPTHNTYYIEKINYE